MCVHSTLTLDICNPKLDLCRFFFTKLLVNLYKSEDSSAVPDIILLLSDIIPNVVNTPKGEVFVAITGKVNVRGISYTRKEFIDLCEEFKDDMGNPIFKIVETKAADKLQYVIADVPSSSEKYKLGMRLNKLITANDFYTELEKLSCKFKSVGGTDNGW